MNRKLTMSTIQKIRRLYKTRKYKQAGQPAAVQVFEAQPLPPELLGLVQVFGTRGLLAVQLIGVVAGKGKSLRLEQIVDVGDLLLRPFAQAHKDFIRRRRIAVPYQIAKLRAPDVERLDIGLQEVEMPGIERVQVVIQPFGRERRIERMPQILAAGKKLRRHQGDLRVIRAGD